MKKVLVMGMNGTFGRHAAKALLDNGYEVTAFLRKPQKLPAELSHIQVIQGNVQDKQVVEQACRGMDILIYAVSSANYDWRGKAIAYLNNVLEVVEKQQMTIIFPGNVYVFDPAEGPIFDEVAAQHPRSEKGEMRKTMEAHLHDAAMRGGKIVILRMGDFLAADSQSSWLAHLIKSGRHRLSISSPGNKNLKHSWAYVPDAANVVVQLVGKLDVLPNFNVFHLRGLQMSIKEIASVMASVTGKPVRIKSFPWWFIKLASPFSVMHRGLLEMRYLWDEEIHLSDQKLRQLLADGLPATNIESALVHSKLLRHGA